MLRTCERQSRESPVCPKRHLSGPMAGAAFGTANNIVHQAGADRGLRDGHVCFGPLSDSCSAVNCVLFDHLVGACEQHRRHVEAERLRGIQVDDKLEPGRLLDGKFIRLCAFQDLVHKFRRSTG